MRVLDLYPVCRSAFEVLREEAGGAYAVCTCPLKCHATSTVRLWIGEDRRLMFGCHAGCNKLEILRAVGLSWKDCYPEGADLKRVKQEVTARYKYRDEAGALLYETVRLEPGRGGRDKDFRQRRPRGRDAGGGWEWNLDGVRRVLYRLPELLAADVTRPVFVVAGEKDADALADLGFVSTTNVCGERSEWLESYSECLADRSVVVIEDRDSAGRRHANEVCGSLTEYAACLRRVRLPAKDATAFLNGLRANGVTGPRELRAAVLAVLTGARTWIGIGAGA